MDIYNHIQIAIKEQGRKQSHLEGKLQLRKGKLTPFLKRQGSLYSNELVDLLLELGFKITDPKGVDVTENKITQTQTIAIMPDQTTPPSGDAVQTK